jgi:hypothetical protein
MYEENGRHWQFFFRRVEGRMILWRLARVSFKSMQAAPKVRARL